MRLASFYVSFNFSSIYISMATKFVVSAVTWVTFFSSQYIYILQSVREHSEILLKVNLSENIQKLCWRSLLMACRRYIQWYISYFLCSFTIDWNLAPHRWGFYITHNDAPQSVGLLWTVVSSSQRPLPDNTQHSQQTEIHAPGGIRNHDLSRRAAAELSLRPRDHWEPPWVTYVNVCKTFNVVLTVHRR